MKVDMDTLKSSIFRTNFQSNDSSTDYVHKVAITDSYSNPNSIVPATAFLAPFFVGLRIKSHKKRSVDFHPELKYFNNEKLDLIQKKLEQALEKWGNINESDHINTFNTTMRP